MSLALNTSLSGTYVITYSAQDKAGNTKNDTRNVYIVDKESTPTISLNSDINGGSRTMIEATKSNIFFEDPGVNATDKYGNNVSSKVEVKIDRYRHIGTLPNNINDFETPVNILPYTLLSNANFSLNVSGNDLLILTNGNNGIKPNLSNGNHNDYHTLTSSSDQASHFKFTYKLHLPNMSQPITVERIVYLVDFNVPVISLSQTSSIFEISTSSNDIKNTVEQYFSSIDNYWDIGTGSNIGFSNLTFEYREGETGTGNIVTNLDTSQNGLKYTVTAKLEPNYTSIGQNLLKANWIGANVSQANKIYTSAIHSITIEGDSIDPVITFVSYSNKTIANLGTLNSVGNDLYWTIPSSGTYSFNNLQPWRQDGITADSEINVSDNDVDNLSNMTIEISYQKGDPANTRSYSNVPGSNNTRVDLGKLFSGSVGVIIGTQQSPAAWIGTYTATDTYGNSHTVQRTVYIIDNTDPTLTLTNNTNDTGYLTYDNNLDYLQDSNTLGFPAYNINITGSTNTTRSDNFLMDSGVVATPFVLLSTLNSGNIYSAYPKDVPSRTFILNYNSSNNKLEVYNYYVNRQVNNVTINGSTTDIHFDLSHESLRHSNITTSLFTNIIATGISDPNNTRTPLSMSNSFAYSNPGHYHSFITFNFGNIDEDSNINVDLTSSITFDIQISINWIP